jgi:hypothetical protein
MEPRDRPDAEADEGRHDRARRVRRLLLGTTLILSPALILLGDVLTPSVDWSDQRDVVATAAERSGRWQLATIIGMVGFMLFVPAAIAAAGLVRRRRPGVALATVVLMGTGGMAVVAAMGVSMSYAGARVLESTEPMAAVAEEVDGLGAMFVLFPMFFAGPVGALVLAWGLWRAKATAVWVPALLAVATVASFAEGTIATVAWVGITIGLAGVAWTYFGGKRPAFGLGTKAGPAPTPGFGAPA